MFLLGAAAGICLVLALNRLKGRPRSSVCALLASCSALTGAVAGALVIFVIACEMTFGWELFKMDNPSGSATIIPIIFPLLAGPGAFTALLALKAVFTPAVIFTALTLNMIIVFLVLRNVFRVEKLIGSGGIYVLRKFFGIILLAIAVKLFVGNITSLI